jgi:hypothetical protein
MTSNVINITQLLQVFHFHLIINFDNIYNKLIIEMILIIEKVVRFGNK